MEIYCGRRWEVALRSLMARQKKGEKMRMELHFRRDGQALGLVIPECFNRDEPGFLGPCVRGYSAQKLVWGKGIEHLDMYPTAFRGYDFEGGYLNLDSRLIFPDSVVAISFGSKSRLQTWVYVVASPEALDELETTQPEVFAWLRDEFSGGEGLWPDDDTDEGWDPEP